MIVQPYVNEVIHISTNQIESAFQQEIVRTEGLTIQLERRDGEAGTEPTTFEEAAVQSGEIDATLANIKPERGNSQSPRGVPDRPTQIRIKTPISFNFRDRVFRPSSIIRHFAK